MEKIYKILANVDQGLNEEEKHQARSNIGAIAGVNVATAGGTTPLVPDENDRVTVDLTDVGGVPSFSGSDNGLVLGVVGSSDPELQWVSKGGGGTSYTAGDGIDIDTNDVISAKVDGTSIGVNASGELESLATVDQHYDASSTNAQSGTAVAEALSGVSGVPSVGSGDNGKVLTADYTGGSGTFSWQDPPAQEQADWTQTNTSAVDFIKNKPNLATVATTGAYSDLSGTPTIPAAQVQSDWAQSDNTQVDFIKNKPTINNVPAVGSSDDGKVLTADYTGGVGSYSWVTPGGGTTYTAGNGIDITSDVISAKLDGSTLTNGSNGLSVTNPVPDTTGASQGDVLSVGSSGLEWVAPGGGGGSNIFVAEYGVTSYTDVIAAIKAGKQIFAKREHLSAQGTVAYMEWGTLCTAYDGPTAGTGSHFDPDDVRSFRFFVSVNKYKTGQPHNVNWSDTVVMWLLDNSGSTGSWSLVEYPAIKPIDEGNGFVITYGAYSNTYSVKVDGTTVGFDSSGNLTVLGGGTTYSAGNGISIDTTNDTISAKVDGTTVSFNSSGELQATTTSYSAGSGISIANDTISTKVDGSSITVNSSGELQATASSLQTKPLVAGTGITLTASASDVTISADSSLIQKLNYGDSEASQVATLLIDSDDPEGYALLKADNVTKGHLVMGPYKGLLDSGLNGGSGKGNSTTPLYIDGNGHFVTCDEMQKKLTAGYRISIGPGAQDTTVIANTMHESVVNTCIIWDTLANNYDLDYNWGNWRVHVHLKAFSDWTNADEAIHIRINHAYASEAAQKIKLGSYQVQNYYPYQNGNTYDFSNVHWYYDGNDPYTTATIPDQYGFKFHVRPSTPDRNMPQNQEAHRFIVDTGAPYGEWLELDASVRFMTPNAAPSSNGIYLMLKGKYAYSYQ